jgi:RNA polymerase-binding transcription factor
VGGRYPEGGIRCLTGGVNQKARDFVMISGGPQAHTEPIASERRKEQSIMEVNLKLIREALEAKLKGTIPTRGLRESIHIQRAADPADLTQQAAERDLAVHSLDRDSTLARRLRSALGRLTDGSYGVCIECGDDIAPKRLHAIPWAELCIRCQETADRAAARKESHATPAGLRKAA